MRISAVIANLNGEELLPPLLDSLRGPAERGILGQVIVADDGSEDASRAVVEESPVDAEYVEKPDGAERGFARNVNRGAQRADGELIAVLNNDLVLGEGVLESLAASVNNDTVGAAVPRVESDTPGPGAEHGGVPESAVRLWTARGLCWLKPLEPAPESAVASAEWRELALHGACFVIGRELWRELDGFDESFSPVYWEDVDLGLRIQRRGLELLYDPTVSVEHAHSATVDREIGAAKMDHMRRNQIRLVRKHAAALGLDGLGARCWQLIRAFRSRLSADGLAGEYWRTALN